MKKRLKRTDKKTNNYKTIIILIIVLIVLILATIYYFNNANKLERRSKLVGDAVCNSFPDEKGQDNCCLNFHKGDITKKQCLGNWKFINSIEECQFICNNSLPICPEDSKVCPDNSVITRNASKECNFDDC